MGHFKLDMRPADYERRNPKRGNAAAWLTLLVVGAIVIGAATILVTGFGGEGIAHLLDSVRIER